MEKSLFSPVQLCHQNSQGWTTKQVLTVLSFQTLEPLKLKQDKQLFYKIKYNLLIYSITLLLLKSEKINKRWLHQERNQTHLSAVQVFSRTATFKWRSRVERNLAISWACMWCLLRSLNTICKSSVNPGSASCSISKTFCTSGCFICSVRALKVAFFSRQR